jgi:uncharacterized integral membrane protein (TIGR00697 family)
MKLHFNINDKAIRLFIILAAFFIANVFIAEFVGVKIFSLESTIGIKKFSFSFFGKDNLGFDLTAGVLLWPIVFIMSDIINEYFGKRGVKLLSYLAAILIAYAFIMFYLAIHTTPPDWWISSNTDKGIPDMQVAFSGIFGQGMWIIVGSLMAFLVSQIIDVTVFHKIKKATGEKWIWLRATGSTLISQFVDSFVVLFIAFYLGNNWSWQKVLAICLMNYIYKFTMAIVF